MKKLIEITPEWILSELPHIHIADGKGNMNIETDSVTDVRWITLALNTLGVPFQEYDESEPTDDLIFFGFEFKIEDIRIDCPMLYEKWMEMNEEANVDRTVETAFERFLAAMSNKVTPNTFQSYRNLKFYMEKFCESRGKELWWYYISKEREAEWREYLNNSTLSKESVRKYINAKKAFMKWCWDNHITDRWEYLAP